MTRPDWSSWMIQVLLMITAMASEKASVARDHEVLRRTP
jgi:hypothetical protein